METQEQRLQAEILSEARDKAEKILSRARRDIRRIEAQAETERGKRREARLAETESEAAEAAKNLEDQMMIEERRRWLNARESVILGVFEAAMKKAVAETGAGRTAYLAELAEEAISRLGAGAYRVKCTVGDTRIVTPAWLSEIAVKALGSETAETCKWEISPDTAMLGGLQFIALDGARSFDNSLEGRLQYMDRELRTLLVCEEGSEAGR